VDLSWVKDLANQANEQEIKRQKDEHQRKADEKQVALATAPFIEKLHVLIQKCAEEFNKYVIYPHLKIVVSRLQKRAVGTLNAGDPELSCPEEKASFMFSRQDWLYAIRGSKGIVEFLELPCPADGASSLNLEQIGVSSSRQLVAAVDTKSQQVIWQYQGRIVGGEDIVNLAQEYLREFIERTKQ